MIQIMKSIQILIKKIIKGTREVTLENKMESNASIITINQIIKGDRGVVLKNKSQSKI